MAKRNKKAAAAFRAKKALTGAQRRLVQRENVKQLKRLSGQRAVTKRLGPG